MRAKDDTRTYPSDQAVIWPWAASGPGWSNAGIYVGQAAAKLEQCVYRDQLGPIAQWLFPVALAAVGALTQAIAREGYRKERP